MSKTFVFHTKWWHIRCISNMIMTTWNCCVWNLEFDVKTLGLKLWRMKFIWMLLHHDTHLNQFFLCTNNSQLVISSPKLNVMKEVRQLPIERLHWKSAASNYCSDTNPRRNWWQPTHVWLKVNVVVNWISKST